MIFDAEERSLLAGLADILIPSGDGLPPASDAGVAGEGLDQVLAFRPDLGAGLKKLLGQAANRNSEEFVAQLRSSDPAGYGLLTELVPAAYFLNPQVREKLGYHGQGPRPIDARTDALDESLLQAVKNRGPIYRPTPK